MNYIPIHTSIHPTYDYMAAENAFLKQDVEYKNAVLCEQAGTINQLQGELKQVTQERDNAKHYEMDARRWQVMKQIILSQGGERQVYEVQKIVDKALAKK